MSVLMVNGPLSSSKLVCVIARGMPSLTLDDRLIWFAHCPKAGGTSVERFLVDQFGDAVGHLAWGWDLWWKAGGWRRARPPNSPQHLVWDDAMRTLPKEPDAVLALVRDPVARIVSEYHYQQSTRRGTRGGRWLANLPFSFWLRLMLRLARLNPYAFDNHLRSQSDFIPEGAAVFRLEDGLEPVERWLARQTGRSLAPLPHKLRSPLPPLAPAARDQALIAHVFAADYARFGYVPAAGEAARPFVDCVAWMLAWPIFVLERCALL